MENLTRSSFKQHPFHSSANFPQPTISYSLLGTPFADSLRLCVKKIIINTNSHLSKKRIKKKERRPQNEKLALDGGESTKMNDIIVCSSAASFICFFFFFLPPILLCVPMKTQTRGESSQSLREREGVNKRQKSRKRKSQEILLHKQLSLVECLINQQWQKGTTINKETPSSQQSAINCTALAKDRKRKREKKKPLRATVYFNSDPKHQAAGDQTLSSDNTKFTVFPSSALLFPFSPWPCVNNSSTVVHWECRWQNTNT